MRIRYSWVITLFSILILVSCNRSVVNLDYTNAQDEIPQLGNLSFRFDKPFVNDSLINRWDSTGILSLNPKSPVASAGNIRMNWFFRQTDHYYRPLPIRPSWTMTC